jgi:hypothetical protein
LKKGFDSLNHEPETGAITTLSTSIAVGITLGSGGYLSPFTITNSGEIANLSYSSSYPGTIAVYVPGSLAPVSILNDGTIIGGDGMYIGGYGVSLYGAGSLTNHGFVRGGSAGFGSGGGGVYLSPDGGSLTNTGTILGGSGVRGGAAAFIPVGDYGLNTGFISGGAGPGGAGAGIRSGGTVVNTGVINGGLDSEVGYAEVSGALLESGVIDNFGTITGGVMVYGGTLINAGTIAGALGSDDFLSNAVTIQNSYATTASTLIVEPGAVFIGNVAAAPTLADVLEFASTSSAAMLSGLGTQFTGFSTLDFATGAQWTISGAANAFDSGETIFRFAPGNAIILNGFTAASHSFVNGIGLELTDTAGTEITLDLTGDLTVTDQPAGTEIEVAVCYLRGSKILTPAGEIAIEHLNIGDAVITRCNGYQKIKWIGRQSFARRFVEKNRDKMPVRIAAGALGPQLPERDLLVSPGHSMLINGVLVLAKFLVNGITITQDFAGAEIHYYQLEFETHDCVLAEGAWSESYADTPGLRTQFHNAAEFYALYPNHQEPPRQTLCAPRPLEGKALERALRPVLSRASAAIIQGRLFGYVDEVGAGHIRGWAWDQGNPDLPVLLEILVHGRVIGTTLACDERSDVQAAGYGQGRCGFAFVLPFGLKRDFAHEIQVRRAADAAPLSIPKTQRKMSAA